MSCKLIINGFKDLNDLYQDSDPCVLYEEFIRRYGVKWAENLTNYVSKSSIETNRKSFYQFYFNDEYSLSKRSDPRSGMYLRSPKSEGGKIELLLYLSLGVENFAQLIKTKRVIDGVQKKVTLDGDELPMDISGFKDSRDQIDDLMDQDEAEWDDSLIKPIYDDAMNSTKNALLDVKKGIDFDEDLLIILFNISLCGAHCPRKKKPPEVAERMSEIHVIGGTIRAVANQLKSSIK